MHIPRRKLYFFVLLEVFIEIEKVFVSKLREESENSYGYSLSLNWSRLKSEAKKGGGAEGGGGGVEGGSYYQRRESIVSK